MTWQHMKPYLAGLAFSSIFGFSFLFTKRGLEAIDTYRLLGFRFMLAALVVSALIACRLVPFSLRGKNILPLVLVALFQPIAYFLFETFGISLGSTSQAGMMIALIPIFVVVMSALVLHESPMPLQILFIILSVSGVIFVVFMQGADESRAGWLGPAVLMGAVLSAAGFNIMSRRSSASFKPFEITFVMMWVGALVFNILAVYIHWSAGSISTFFQPLSNPLVISSLLYLGIGSSVVAFFLVNYSLSQLPASQSAVFANLTTVVSIAAGVFFRNEPFYWYHAVGAGMIVTGVWGTNYVGHRTKRRKLDVAD